MLSTLVPPNIAYALTSGPHQPEYTSYESGSASDMVNLLTGNFSFSLPILSVPVGTEGSFTVPLSYHSGIGLEQEASWVGLGWNINVGSITRSINGFPDDANGEAQAINVKDLTGRRGWSSSFLGTNIGWDSEAGHYGVINLGIKVGYQNGDLSSVGIAGLTLAGGDVTFNAMEFAMTVVQVVMAIVTYGGSEVANIGLKIAMDIGIQLAMDAIMPDFTPSLGAQGYWKYSKETDKDLFHTDYWIWLDKTRIEDMYGVLNLDKSSQLSSSGSVFTDSDDFLKVRKSASGGALQSITQFPQSVDIRNKGAASDINININDDDYLNNNSPAVLAYDNYHVNGPGISGSIKPYRLEMGAVSVPREMASNHRRLNPLPFLDYGSEKVPFVYEGENSNAYYHHVGGATAITSPIFNFGIDPVVETGAAPGFDNDDVMRLNLNDIALGTQRIRSDVNSRKKIPKANFVDWLTNGEIKNTTGRFVNHSAYLDYFPPATRANFRQFYQFGGRSTLYGSTATNGVITLQANQNNSSLVPLNQIDINLVTEYLDSEGNVVYRSSSPYNNLTINSISGNQLTVNQSINFAPTNGYIEIISKSEPKPDQMIGGFVITSADGMNYHYTIPVYDYDFKTQQIDLTDDNKNSTISRSGQFANTWLLTAITGPDFIDRGGANNQGDGYIDENDWGYWIKFNYGSHVTDYKWRMPYSGYTITSDNKFKTYAEGMKEKYYLNSIESRSHVALFIKDTRKDAKDAGTSSVKKTSLKLGEITLLTRQAYKQLTDPIGTFKLADCSGKINVCYQYTKVGEENESVNGTKATFIQANALRRIVFNTDYALCNGAPNSDYNTGKLTLNSISIFGANSAKVMPDYKFQYANNPAYNLDRWDGWGMYSSSGTNSGYTHKSSEVETDGIAWNLTSVKSPLGNLMTVTYERDTYSSISGNRVYGRQASFSTYGDTPQAESDIRNNIIRVSTTGLKVGDVIEVSGTSKFRCSPDQVDPIVNTYGPICKIVEIGSGYIKIDASNYANIYCLGSVPDVIIDENVGTVKKVNKLGGDVRVAAIDLTDNWGARSRVVYQYADAYGVTSGVVSVEPDYIRGGDLPFYSWLGYPSSPVLYGKVTVLNGKNLSPTDYHTKTQFDFITPSTSHYTTNTDVVLKDKVVLNSYQEPAYPNPKFTNTYVDKVSLFKHEISRRTSKVGKLLSVKTYDASNSLYSRQDYQYTETLLNNGTNNYQGIESEGTVMMDLLSRYPSSFMQERYYKLQRTSVLNYPFVLKKVVTTVDGQVSEQENISWDFVTGGVLESESKSPFGVRTRTIYEPVYKLSASGYSELASKAIADKNKNMLTQIGATYAFRVNDNGTLGGLLAASATTWKKDWSNYRKLSGGNYVNDADAIDTNGDGMISTAELLAVQIWRKNNSYGWRGSLSRLQQDGTHEFNNATDKFNHASPGSNTNWIKLGSQQRYDHYSHLLESSDMKDFFSSAKYGHGDRLIIATASNSRYEEMAFSGAEDRLSTSSPFFAGEIGLGSGTIVSSPTHTGVSALQVSTGYGFVFKSTAISANKKYKASVWVNNSSGKIYYKINGGTEVLPTPVVSPPVVKGGVSWYKIDVLIPVGNVTTPTIEVGVKSGTGTAMVFDDFRFHPFDATMVSYVYDVTKDLLLYELGPDNTYIRYEYNDKRILTKSYKESILYGEKLVTESKEDFRRFYIDQ
jgi:hypothetical protein